MSTWGLARWLEGIGCFLLLSESPLFFYSFILSHHHFQLLSLAIIGVVAVIVIGFTVVLVWDNVRHLETELHQRLSLASDLAALTLALPLWELNFAQIKDFAEALFKDRDMVYVNII